VTHVQGHTVKYWNRNNSAVDCMISLKFGRKFDHIAADALQISKADRSQVKITGSKVKCNVSAVNTARQQQADRPAHWCGNRN